MHDSNTLETYRHQVCIREEIWKDKVVLLWIVGGTFIVFWNLGKLRKEIKKP